MSATDGENVEKVAKLLNDDRRYTCSEIAQELDISHGSAHSILTERLKMRKVAARGKSWLLWLDIWKGNGSGIQCSASENGQSSATASARTTT